MEEVIQGKIIHQYLQSDIGKSFRLSNPYKNRQMIDLAEEVARDLGEVEPELFHDLLKAYKVIN